MSKLAIGFTLGMVVVAASLPSPENAVYVAAYQELLEANPLVSTNCLEIAASIKSGDYDSVAHQMQFQHGRCALRILEQTVDVRDIQ